ncbi:hypothetical protein N7528_009187 [Penicillium herquei]|nr:hypothetical protein N7528_009187 [Penicillium herquei]
MNPRYSFSHVNHGVQVAVNHGPMNTEFNIHADPLDKLEAAFGAELDSYMVQHEDECLPGTRIDLLHNITEWATSPHGKCIFWLNGVAGAGKSTISRTVGRSLKNDNLVVSFFLREARGIEAMPPNSSQRFPDN